MLSAYKKILLFGGTGNTGTQIAQVLHSKGYKTTAVIRNANQSNMLNRFISTAVIVNLKDLKNIEGICNGFDVVISALGKLVSPFNRSKESFRDIDYNINVAILKDAVNAGVSKFVYISAFHSEKFQFLEYFKVHQDFSDQLMASGINFSIIKPPAIYSAFKDVFSLAQKGRLVTLGKGDKKTNPIYEGDLALIVVESINDHHSIIEAGGPEILTRHELNTIIQRQIAPGKKIWHTPLWLIHAFLPMIKWFSRNTYDKLAFFVTVMEEDTIAPMLGTMPFSEYVRVNK